MEFLHEELRLNPGDIVEVTIDAPANVMLMDSTNFTSYQSGISTHYYGGYADKSPVRLATPHSGKWHVIVNLGGYPGRVRAGVRVLQEAF